MNKNCQKCKHFDICHFVYKMDNFCHELANMGQNNHETVRRALYSCASNCCFYDQGGK